MAVSGGSDSVALAFLAKNTFKRVLGITVDHQCVLVAACVTNNACCLSHRVRDGSAEEAEKTKEIVTRMGNGCIIARVQGTHNPVRCMHCALKRTRMG